MKQKLFLVILVQVWFVFNIFGQQQADSLLQLIRAEDKPQQKAMLLNELGKYYRQNNIDSAYKYTSLAKEIAQQENLPEQLAEAYNQLGIVWYKQKDKDSAFFYLNQGYITAKENEDYQGMVKSLNSIGIYKTKSKKYDEASAAFNEAMAYSQKVTDKNLLSMLYNNTAILNKARANVESALEYYLKALSIAEEQNNLKSTGLITSNIALLYEAQDKTDLALKYLNRSLAIRQNSGNKRGESYVRTNIGLVYENLKEYDQALEQYRKSLALKKELNSPTGIAILYNNMGIVFKKQARYDSAFYYCNMSLPLRIEKGNKYGEARTRTTLGQLHLLNGNYTKAKEELTRALQLADGYKNYTFLENVHSSLYEVYAAEKNYENALLHILKRNAFKDSIFNIDKEKSIANIETRYDALKKEKENLLLLQENALKDEKIKHQIIIGIGLISLVILFLLLLLLVYRSRLKLSVKNKEIEHQASKLEEAFAELKKLSEFKEAMTNMLVHDLKTPLNVIINIKSLKGMPSIDDVIQQSGYTMQNLVHNILDVYKYQNTKLKLHATTISLNSILNQAFEEVSYLATEKKLQICIKNNTDHLVEVDEDLIKRVFVNLLSNAVRFTPNGETISIKTQLETPEKLRIGVSNPGPGIPKEKHELIFEYFKQAEHAAYNHIKSSGLGLNFCKLAVEAHNGKVGVTSETPKGVEFWFTLPHVKQEIPLKNTSTFDWIKIG